ncbi:hypothetical protein PsorP6_002295 [Peronosclerospora sorghi]|uniref:Uncharacterized protein n=1 Tax=Peronosclerospora sorghi TaxID=230839 RepID=A0ACC0WW15_9STRA|nr:hypothetical protein PsorP6_002295 [Peronosclerospora sorghi]
MIIHKSKNPREFRNVNVKNLGFDYEANQSAWMLSEAGHVLVSAERQRSIGVGRKYGFQSTVGVLAQLVGHEEDRVEMLSGSMSQSTCAPFSSSGGNVESSFGVACVRFTVDGIALRDSNNSVMKFTLPIPSRSELYPTLTMHLQDVHVYSRM